jgi:P27 family predicted phage terminase small subunit
MAKGRKPLSQSVKEASGSFVKHPERRNNDEPKPKLGSPDCPEAVASDPVAKARWHWVCDQLDSMKLLAVTDQGLIAGYCLDYSMMLSLWEVIKGGNVSDMDDKGRTKLKPEANQFHTYSDRLLKREAELGLTPSSRSRLKAPQTEKEDEFTLWLKRREERRRAV